MTPVAIKDMPDVLKQATVAIEDERFYKHTRRRLRGHHPRRGQERDQQEAEAGRLDADHAARPQPLHGRTPRAPGIEGYERKIREARLARDLEKTHSKEWVLGKYLNTVPYGTVGGQTAIGAGAAARLYFNKRVQDLTLREAAMLAGMPQAPSDYSPTGNPDGTKRAPQRGPGARWPSSG